MCNKPPDGSDLIGETFKDEPENSIYLFKEVVDFDKKWINTGKVTLKRTTTTTNIPLNDTLKTLQASIEVKAVNQYVTEVPEIREVDNVLIIPVIEEHIEIVKKIFLKQEVKLHKKMKEHYFNKNVEVKEQHLEIIRTNSK